MAFQCAQAEGLWLKRSLRCWKIDASKKPRNIENSEKKLKVIWKMILSFGDNIFGKGVMLVLKNVNNLVVFLGALQKSSSPWIRNSRQLDFLKRPCGTRNDRLEGLQRISWFWSNYRDLRTPQEVAKGNGTLAISGKYRLVKYLYGSKDPLLGMHLGYNLGGKAFS